MIGGTIISALKILQTCAFSMTTSITAFAFAKVMKEVFVM